VSVVDEGVPESDQRARVGKKLDSYELIEET